MNKKPFSINKRLINRVLKRALRLIESPTSWRKGAAAGHYVDGELVSTHPTDPRASCWCASGAVNNAVVELVPWGAVDIESTRDAVVVRTMDALTESLTKNARSAEGGVITFNDDRTTTHKKVINLFERAVARTSPVRKS